MSRGSIKRIRKRSEKMNGVSVRLTIVAAENDSDHTCDQLGRADASFFRNG